MHLVDTLLVVMVLTGIYLLGTTRLIAAIRTTAFQGVVLSVLPILIHGSLEWHTVAISVGTLGLKVFLIPAMLVTAMRRAETSQEIEPFVSFGTSVVLGGALVAVSIALGDRLTIPAPPGHPVPVLLVPSAFATLLIGLLILVSRKKALSQVVGYVVLENGIFLFGLLFVEPMPLLFEMGVLLDVFLGVFIMGIVIYHISRAFDHIDTHALSTLRD